MVYSPLSVLQICHFVKNFESLGQLLSVYLVFGKIFSLHRYIYLCKWANFHYCKYANIDQLIYPTGRPAHT